jgi:4-amino-4-deoxychorismate lyase
MRSILIDEIFPGLQLAVRINHITEIELSAASEIFICNSVKGIVPVTGILNQDQSKIKPIAIGSNTRDLQLMLAQLYPSFK